MMSPKHLKRRRAFALIMAIGVLALLFIIVMAAGNSAQLSYTWTSTHVSDYRYRNAIDEAANYLAARGASAGEQGTSETLKLGDVVVSAHGSPAGDGPQLSPLPPQPGDVNLLLSATSATSGRVHRTAIYLLRPQPQGNVAVLIDERRLW